MAKEIERYQKLGLRESLHRIYRYPSACNELSFLLRGVYSKVPKNLQSLIFQDTLSAFRLLPQVQTESAVSAANRLLQCAEASFPKHKKMLAVTEFKQAKVAHKRRCKTRQEEEGSLYLPQDVLVHIFSFLDLQSLVAAGFVCWSWNMAAGDDHLWQTQYTMFFTQLSGCLLEDTDPTHLQDGVATNFSTDWRDAFKRTYKGNLSKRFKSNRGYCGSCHSIVWLSNMKCSNEHCVSKVTTQRIKPVSPRQIIEYILDDEASMISSSDSDSDSDGDSVSRLWAYRRN